MNTRYCNYCKRRTAHSITDESKDGNEAGRCLSCGSSNLTKIQGFDANLM